MILLNSHQARLEELNLFKGVEFEQVDFLYYFSSDLFNYSCR